MDLGTVTAFRRPTTRDDLALGTHERFLGGGSWLFSEPQVGVVGLVDLTALGWPSLVASDSGLSVAATCTFAELAAWMPPSEWRAGSLFRQCCTALLGSFKVWNVATVGGNICLALPAGPMTSLAASLDATAVVWHPDGSERRERVLDLVIGVESTTLGPGEVLRSVEFPAATLNSRTGYRKIALSPLGRSGTLVIARLDDDDTFVVTVSAGTTRPVQLRWDGMPAADELEDAVRMIDCWYDDAHGAPDWRAAMSALLAEELRRELGGVASGGSSGGTASGDTASGGGSSGSAALGGVHS